MNKFKAGDAVVVRNKAIMNDGKTGVVQTTENGLVRVTLDFGGGTHRFSPSSIQLRCGKSSANSGEVVASDKTNSPIIPFIVVIDPISFDPKCPPDKLEVVKAQLRTDISGGNDGNDGVVFASSFEDAYEDILKVAESVTDLWDSIVVVSGSKYYVLTNEIVVKEI